MTLNKTNETYKDTLESFYRNEKEFTSDLEKAKKKASNPNQHDFLAQLEERYSKYGMKMFISEAQYEWLVTIINK